MSEQHFFTQQITYFGNHGSIVIGKGGSTVKALRDGLGLSLLRAFRDDDGSQYFIVKGIDERAVDQAVIQIQGLIISSMARKEQSQIDALVRARFSHEEIRIKLLETELHPSNFPSLASTLPIRVPPLTKATKKVSFAPMVMCTRQIPYPCETNT
tara:strand:- start:759 stop:1223 length:465 start_codon:yes stop_codon:yes gene_type:complete